MCFGLNGGLVGAGVAGSGFRQVDEVFPLEKFDQVHVCSLVFRHCSDGPMARKSVAINRVVAQCLGMVNGVRASVPAAIASGFLDSYEVFFPIDRQVAVKLMTANVMFIASVDPLAFPAIPRD
jgi:hypothetical protein